VATPLPAALPSLVAAGIPYVRRGLVDRRVVAWSVGFGIPATVIGALATRWISGTFLVRLTDVVLIALGVRILTRFASHERATRTAADIPAAVLAAVAVGVGLVSGLLANSGGFLLAPLFVTVLGLPIRRALANSLAVAAVLAIPGTIVHALLGHINWIDVAVFAAASVPLSYTGATVAMRTNAVRLERFYGVALIVLGVVFLTVL